MKRSPSEAPTEPLAALESWEYDDHPSYPSMRLMKLLFVAVTVVAVAASVAIALRMSNQSEASAPTVDAHRGDCLTWSPGAPERAMKVDCADEHLFEVADSEAMEINSDPGSPAAEGELRQTCARAVTHYLGPRYDPDGRFVVGIVWTPLSGRLLCGLQLASDGIASVGFRGRVIDQDQSSVWPAGTCLGIRDGQPTEATGWVAGTRRIACRIGSAKPDGGWATLLGNAKTGVLTDGQAAASPPSPAELPSPAEPPPAEETAPVAELLPGPPPG